MATTLVPAPPPAGRYVSRRDARRMTMQACVGIGAILLAAVDDWNTRVLNYPAPLRTSVRPLGRGTHIAAMVGAGVATWLRTPHRHPAGHQVLEPWTWPEVSSHNKIYMMIHHEEMEATNNRRKAYLNQDAARLNLVDDPTLCELTWDYDVLTEERVTHIWLSAPYAGGYLWEPIEVPLRAAAARYKNWSRRDVEWLPRQRRPIAGAIPISGPSPALPDPTIRIVPRPDAQPGS